MQHKLPHRREAHFVTMQRKKKVIDDVDVAHNHKKKNVGNTTRATSVQLEGQLNILGGLRDKCFASV